MGGRGSERLQGAACQAEADGVLPAACRHPVARKPRRPARPEPAEVQRAPVARGAAQVLGVDVGAGEVAGRIEGRPAGRPDGVRQDGDSNRPRLTGAQQGARGACKVRVHHVGGDADLVPATARPAVGGGVREVPGRCRGDLAILLQRPAAANQGEQKATAEVVGSGDVSEGGDRQVRGLHAVWHHRRALQGAVRRGPDFFGIARQAELPARAAGCRAHRGAHGRSLQEVAPKAQGPKPRWRDEALQIPCFSGLLVASYHLG
mmetsp:Transcript_1187/g.3497  ORF Transcript_1187/g.3497 Transcript_1187/m.3497 type:complete len:262 (+) Transcript_1187:302-1087(+)